MPQRRLPQSEAALLKAMRTGKDRKDSMPPPLVIPYSSGTISKLDTFYPAYKLKVLTLEAALQTQTSVTATVKDTKQLAIWFISDFFSALQSAIRRKTFNPSVRAFYGLAVNDEKIPTLKTEADILFWGDKAAAGETARIAAGGVPITFPNIAEVNTAVTNFTNPNLAQANAKEAYDAAQEALQADRAEAEKLVLKMWNETEAAFDEGDKASMRRKAREWGVVYVPNPGEAPNPDEFSIAGKITDTNGNKLEDVTVYIVETDLLYNSDASGNYFAGIQPPGTYTVQAHKNGFSTIETPGVVVAAGVVTILNFVLSPMTTGSISGLVKAPGNTLEAATVTLVSTGQTAATNLDGTYQFTNVPAGAQAVNAYLNSNPGNVQSKNATVIAGADVVVNFEF